MQISERVSQKTSIKWARGASRRTLAPIKTISGKLLVAGHCSHNRIPCEPHPMTKKITSARFNADTS